MKQVIYLLALGLITQVMGMAADSFEEDVIQTSDGPLKITFIGHGSLMMTFKGKVIHVDPFSKLADYAKLPKADLILLTHHHRDHLDQKALGPIMTEKTTMVFTKICSESVKGGMIMKNADKQSLLGIKIEAIPAYNIKHKRDNGEPFHPKGDGNGYILTFGDTRVYVAGDTENTPEMVALKDIDIAFLPMNLPYTMTPKMVADATSEFKPKVLYPYHYGETDTQKLLDLLKNQTATEVRIRKMK